ncbi:hypothetical protein E2C06_24320 [Dankookia rubra]|uniref:Uncharacterized protein n=1 Tax=Dankookia rubra TaxID=1442381 RepID=A0A4R5QBA4_9PROT|nr:hypothetical protein [Dankookia rubra]TDH60003.1 hypothetical protein E2C06_24320 [Dankookia rubra]
MLKGSIEEVTAGEVAGWAYVDNAEMRGKPVLAFLDQECVGAGEVSIFRQDLADAGLGDGFLGFNFNVRIPSPADRARVVIRVGGSDAILLQSNATIVSRAAPRTKVAQDSLGRSLTASSLQWMLARGWLTQADHDFLKFFTRMGVYDRTLRVPRTTGEAADPGRQDPALVARDLLSLFAMREVEISKRQLRQQDDLLEQIAKHTQAQDVLPILALWSAERGKLSVAEGSHAANDQVDMLPFIDYPLGPDRLLLLDAEIRIRKPDVLPQGGAVLFVAKQVS